MNVKPLIEKQPEQGSLKLNMQCNSLSSALVGKAGNETVPPGSLEKQKQMITMGTVRWDLHNERVITSKRVLGDNKGNKLAQIYHKRWGHFFCLI